MLKKTPLRIGGLGVGEVLTIWREGSVGLRETAPSATWKLQSDQGLVARLSWELHV